MRRSTGARGWRSSPAPSPSRAGRDVVFAWRVCKHVSSNAIVLASGGQTIGIGAGQMSRVDAVRLAVAKAAEFGHDAAGSVLASDAFFPFADGPELALAAGVTVARAARRLETRRGGRGRGRRGGRGYGSHRPPPLPPLGGPSRPEYRRSGGVLGTQAHSEGLMAELDPLRWKALAVVCAAFFMTDPRRLDRERRAADDRQVAAASRATTSSGS